MLPDNSSEVGIPLKVGKGVYALSHPYDVDGRVSWHAPEARGLAPMNAYLIREDDEALMLDTGLAVHESAILAQLEQLIEPGAKLSLLCLRFGEFDSMCNLLPILERFGLERFYGLFPNGEEWADFRAEPRAAAETRCGRLLQPAEGVRTGLQLEVTVGADRRLQAVLGPLHLLVSFWVYDQISSTLFTNDVFNHMLVGEDGSFFVSDPGDDRLSAEALEHALLGTRFWWLPEADVSAIRSGLDDLFADRRIETIAPASGCIVSGAEAVERCRRNLDRTLKKVGR